MPNPFDPGFYDTSELRRMGFSQVGDNVRIAKNCTIVGLENIVIGDHVRIDAYCTIVATGHLYLGSHIHIAAHCHLSAGDGIRMEDFSGIATGVRLYTRTDDFTGSFLTGPMVPHEFTRATRGMVTLGRHVVVGSQSVVLPNVSIGEGSCVGALSLVTKSLEPWGIYVGCPVRRFKERSQRLLDLEAEMRRQSAG
jgi:acetyltransferase-like isoleucine patch superfamily enzyme